MYLAAFVACLVAVMVYVGRVGDQRDMAAGFVIVGQFAVEHVFSGNFLVSGVNFLLSAVLFLYFSTRITGTFLGIVSAMMAVIAALAFFSVIPSDRGAGVAYNYHHYISLLYYVQLAILGVFTSVTPRGYA